ncbi:MAG: transposase [Deltaproteobacteria bacterium]|nr:transposase [Deltaproteobacteria bacterium]
MPRQARLDAPGTLHHVIVRGIERRRIVDDEVDRKRFVDRIGELALATDTKIYAWALMTNHAHLLIASGPKGIASFMRRLLTGYAVIYNLRHRRHGHLFQNRYKSIVCDAESYFTELVRYIHLNPLRVKLVTDLGELERYPYCGHGAITGKIGYPWQDRDYVLGWFSAREKEAVKAYREFVREGVSLGRRPELVGGGLRSLGGWSEVVSLRREGKKEWSDERILGSGAFVERVLKEAERSPRQRYRGRELQKRVQRLFAATSRKHKVTVQELRSGSRRGRTAQARADLIRNLVKRHGLPLAEIARQVGISTSGVSRVLNRAQTLSI